MSSLIGVVLGSLFVAAIYLCYWLDHNVTQKYRRLLGDEKTFARHEANVILLKLGFEKTFYIGLIVVTGLIVFYMLLQPLYFAAFLFFMLGVYLYVLTNNFHKYFDLKTFGKSLLEKADAKILELPVKRFLQYRTAPTLIPTAIIFAVILTLAVPTYAYIFVGFTLMMVAEPVMALIKYIQYKKKVAIET